MSAPKKSYNVLFLCTQNVARSIMGEVVATTYSQGYLVGYSAGSHPGFGPHPYVQRLARRVRYSCADLRSKSWAEFVGKGAPQMDIVITLCDNIVGQTCPIWPGNPITGHWSFPDPAKFAGIAQMEGFKIIFKGLRIRVEAITELLKSGENLDYIEEELPKIHERLSTRNF